MTVLAEERERTPPAIGAAPGCRGTKAARLSDLGAAGFVWGIWAAASVALFIVVARSTANVPLWDEWQMVPVLTRRGLPSPQWLWAPWSEHRVPLPRLILVGLFRITSDFRTPIFLGLIVLCGLAAALMRSSARLRGRPAYADAVFPLLLLHPGHGENVLQGWDFQNVLFCLLTCAIVITVVRPGRDAPRIVVAGLLTLLLPLDGAAGAVMVPALAGGLFIWAISAARRRRYAAAAAATAIGFAGLAQLGTYVLGLPASNRLLPQPAEGLVGALMFFASGLGPAGRAAWPLTTGASAVLAFAACLFLFTGWRSGDDIRERMVGLLCALAGLTCVALAVAIGRFVFRSDFALETRYALLAAPALLTACLGAGLCQPRIGRAVQAILFGIACAAAVVNWRDGLAEANRHRDRLQAFTTDVRSGVPPSFLLARHEWLVPRWSPEQIAEPSYLSFVESCMADLRRAHVGVFAVLRDMPATRIRTISPTPESCDRADWSGRVAVAAGPGSTLTFSLGRQTPVCGILLDAWVNEGVDDPDSVRLFVSWPGSGATQTAERHTLDVRPGRSRRIAAWVDAPIDRFTVQLEEGPCSFRPIQFQLLEPIPTR